MKTLHLVVSGYVQGVGYRYFVYKAATKHNITGTVRNLHDGRVEILAQGADEDLQDFLDEVRRGPMFARVNSVQVTEEPDEPHIPSFNITY